MANKNYDEEQVVRQLNKLHDVFIELGSGNIMLLFGNKAKGDVGIKSRGKIDFLVNFRGYRKQWTN
jgi:hypothetical protein